MQVRDVCRTKLMAAGLAVALAAGGCATVDDSKSWVDLKTPGELRTLFSDKTFTGKGSYDIPSSWVSYNRADGHGLFVIDARKYPYTWAVSGEDRICTQSERGGNCYRYQRHASTAKFYRSLNLKTERYNEFTVDDGVPKF